MEVARAANLCPAVLRLSRFHHTLCGSQSVILFRANCCNLYGHIARNNIIKLAVTKSVVKSGETEDGGTQVGTPTHFHEGFMRISQSV